MSDTPREIFEALLAEWQPPPADELAMTGGELDQLRAEWLARFDAAAQLSAPPVSREHQAARRATDLLFAVFDFGAPMPAWLRRNIEQFVEANPLLRRGDSSATGGSRR